MESLDGYFRSFGAAEFEGIGAIAMDMWPPCISSTLRNVPGARDKIRGNPYLSFPGRQWSGRRFSSTA